MLQKHSFLPAALPQLPDQAPDTTVTPVRHNRLFELLRHDATVEPTEEEQTTPVKRKEFAMSDDDMLALQATAMQSLRLRGL
ncbi:MAG: hypothetical protein ABJL99_09920 [Aliishimia sp.]